jgi:hypothetical protein
MLWTSCSCIVCTLLDPLDHYISHSRSYISENTDLEQSWNRSDSLDTPHQSARRPLRSPQHPLHRHAPRDRPALDFVLSALAEGKRLDGRLPLEMREAQFKFGEELGWCECRLGDTT